MEKARQSCDWAGFPGIGIPLDKWPFVSIPDKSLKELHFVRKNVVAPVQIMPNYFL
jgi:hypothetical protein